MIEIRIHGRGGQGSVTMAELLAEAAFYGQKQSQAFPSFGVERRGAPVMAFVRLDDKPIRLRSQVYSPDFAIVQDPSLIEGGILLADVKPGATILINSARDIECRLPAKSKIRRLAANEIAQEIIGRPIINTVMLGAFAAVSGLIELSDVERAIRHHFSGDLADKNVLAARRGYEIMVNN